MVKLIDRLETLNDMVTLGILKAKVKVKTSPLALVTMMENEVERIQAAYTLENYRNHTLEASRKVYKTLGKDPSRYRISSDSLFRRIIKDKGVYYVNNVVDINNIISLKTLWSIGAYDCHKIEGPVNYGVGTKEDVYEGIGRGILNIENLPVLKDDIGPFGSATSDSLRTMVTEETTSLMMVIHAFGGDEGLKESLEMMKALLELYAGGEDFEITIL